MALPSGQPWLQSSHTGGWGQSDGKEILWICLAAVFAKKAMFFLRFGGGIGEDYRE